MADEASKANTPAASPEAVNKVIDACNAQASVLERMAGGVQDMRNIVQRSINLAAEAADDAEEARKQAALGSSAMEGLAVEAQSLTEILGFIHEATAVIREIQKRSRAIEDLARQSNMLSLNASVEAARAGEHGRGFAVVAESVRSMAEQSRAAAIEIAESVEKGTSLLHRLAQQSEQQLKRYEATAEASTEAFAHVVEAIDRMASKASEIHHTSQDHDRTAGALSSSIQQSTEDNSRRVAELVAALTGVQVRDVAPEKVYPYLHKLKIIDVRRPDEFTGELGHIEGAELLTIGDDFEHRIASFDKSRPYLFVCRSGGRSARAARIALTSGFKYIFNMEGGMLRWNELSLPRSKQAA